jgi:hypothetical protein
MKRTTFKGRGRPLVELKKLAVELGQRVSPVEDEFVAKRNLPVRYGQETRPGSALTDRGAPRTNIRSPRSAVEASSVGARTLEEQHSVGWRERADIHIATRIRFR